MTRCTAAPAWRAASALEASLRSGDGHRCKDGRVLTLPLKYAQVINLGYGHDLQPLPIKMTPMEFFLHWHTLAILRDGWLWDELA